MMKSLIVLFFFLASLAISAQTGDVAIHVAKHKSIIILPCLTALHSGYTYDFVVAGIEPAQVMKAEATFGDITSKSSKDGKSLELKVTVVGSSSSTGTIRLLGDKNKLIISQEYKIVSTIRYTDYLPDLSRRSKSAPVILFLGKDTLADNGTVSAQKLRTANSLSLFDGNIPPAAIRRNLMCKITVMQDSTSLIAHSALNYLSEKVKQTIAKAKPGDRIYISAMETLWIDADRSDHIATYGQLTYTLTVTE